MIAFETLALLGRRRGEPRSERVSADALRVEPRAFRCALHDARDASIVERRGAESAVSVDTAKKRALRSAEPRVERAHGTELGAESEGNALLGAVRLLVAFRAAQPDDETFAHMRDVSTQSATSSERRNAPNHPMVSNARFLMSDKCPLSDART